MIDCPKFQAEFGVAEEEPDDPFERFVERYLMPSLIRRP